MHEGHAQQVPNSSGTAPAKLKAPAGACDCHQHIYDGVRFSPANPKARIVPNARVEDYRLLQRRIGITRDIVVTPTPLPAAVGDTGGKSGDALRVREVGVMDKAAFGLHTKR